MTDIAARSSLLKAVCEGGPLLERTKVEAERSFALMRGVEDNMRSLVQYFDLSSSFGSNQDISKIGLDDIKRWADEHIASSEELRSWIDLQNTLKGLRKSGLDMFVEEVRGSSIASLDIERAFLKRFYHLWIDAVYGLETSLRSFDGRQHQEQIAEFRSLDEKRFMTVARGLSESLEEKRRAVLQGLPGEKDTEAYLIRREIAKKRGHKAVRKLFTESPNAVLELRPCFLMSPISVSQYLDPSKMKFDLVIFDEASIRPEDAIGSIMRGAQTIIVGDNKQLPPTSFFNTVDESEEGAQDLESILDECATIGIPQKMLLWHYRSRDESLIDFSNRNFYEGKLNTFPSPVGRSSDLGVEMVYVPDGVYERGTTRKNRQRGQMSCG